MYRVLLSEPNAAVATAVRVVLEQKSFAVDVVADLAEIRSRNLSPYAALVIDVHREPRHGLDLVEWIYRERAELLPRVIVITGDDADAIREALATTGVCDVVIKPVNATEILRAVIECLENSPEFAVH
ncbi:MAG TPA: response regulator [Thermoanaerobaculia bacterium]|nr:response regulator [Thermoanaerobaculia bacterium]